MSNIKTYMGQATTQVEYQLEVISIEKNLSVFRLTTKTSSQDAGFAFKAPKSLDSTTVVQGFVNDRNLSALRNGRPWSKLSFNVFPKDVREHYATTPWHLIERGTVITEVFDYFKAGGVADDVVQLDYGCHMLFDRHGEPLPVGVMFDYINGRITDRVYDLKKLVEILLARDDVHVYRSDNHVDINSRATTVEEAIKTIPYYNSDCGNDSVCFSWQPSLEEYRLVWKTAKSLNPRYPSTEIHRAVFELDILGLRSGGAAKFKGFYDNRYDD